MPGKCHNVTVMMPLLIAYLAVTGLLTVLLVLIIAVQRLSRAWAWRASDRDVPVPADQRARALADHH